REAPLFGIGYREYSEQVGQVAHNSFVHCYTELGFFGGTAFLGAFFCTLLALFRLGGQRVPTADPALARLRPYVLTLVLGYTAGPAEPTPAECGESAAPPVTSIRPAEGWQWLNLRELWQFRELAFFLAWRDVKVRYKQTLLGAMWAVLQPLMMMIVFTIFFSR